MNKDTQLVVQSNALIEATYRLDLVEKRLILLAISECRRTGQGIRPADDIEIRATDYAETFNVPVDEAYVQLREAADQLFQRMVTIYEPNTRTGKEDKRKMRWLASVKYKDGDGCIELEFAPKMVPHISMLEQQFTKYTVGMVSQMSSPYAIRLYELLKQYQSVGVREIGVSELKKILLLESKYEQIKDFKKRVIDVAVAQINAEHIDITVSYTNKKRGRIITHLVFSIMQKEETHKAKKQKAVPQIPAPAFDKTKATKKDAAIYFLQHCCIRYTSDHAATHAPHIVLGTKPLWDLYRADFEDWLTS